MHTIVHKIKRSLRVWKEKMTEVSFWKCTRKKIAGQYFSVKLASCASWFSAAKWDISRRLLFGLSPLTLERKSTHFSKPLPVQRKQWAAFKTQLLRHTFLIRTIKIFFIIFYRVNKAFQVFIADYGTAPSSVNYPGFLESDWFQK